MAVQRRGEETHNRILDAALEAFAQYAYDDTGVAEICRLAGVTKGGSYHHFSSDREDPIIQKRSSRHVATGSCDHLFG